MLLLAPSVYHWLISAGIGKRLMTRGVGSKSYIPCCAAGMRNICVGFTDVTLIRRESGSSVTQMRAQMLSACLSTRNPAPRIPHKCPETNSNHGEIIGYLVHDNNTYTPLAVVSRARKTLRYQPLLLM
jgi:hypothetical protein